MYYAVLDGISSAYPPVMGRLHTCYSPVRRSPAGESKLSPPLPLDLHVLSLSLAFILSQDQTLRCCLSCFSFFSSKKSSKTSVSVVTVVPLACVGLADTFWPDCRFIVAGRNLTEFLESVAAPRRTRSDSVSCTTSSLL